MNERREQSKRLSYSVDSSILPRGEMGDLIRLSYNSGIINKPEKGALVPFADGFLPVEVDISQFVDLVKAGFAFSAQYKDNQRKTDNFICSDFIAVDIDHGLSLEDAKHNQFIIENASFIYTTPSHTELENRFRIVFVTSKTITKVDEWKKALQGVGRKFGGDPSIKDGARLFYGNINAEIWKFNKTLSEDAYKEIQSLAFSKMPSLSSGPAPSHSRSDAIELEQFVTTRFGQVAAIKDLPRSTGIYCPIHIDNNPSAFIVVSKQGIKGVCCSACQTTYWTKRNIKNKVSAFDELVRERLPEKNKVNDVDRLGIGEVEKERIIQTSKKYLPNLSYAKGITLVKSPKGTGKTAALRNIVQEIKQLNRSKILPDAPKSILLIGHRQALLREACNKLGLTCYLDSLPTNYYGICLDSLGTKLHRSMGVPAYDLIIIDESEQVFSHLVSDTIMQRSNGLDLCFKHLKFYLEKAKAIIALDADLDAITITALAELRKNDWERDLRIIHNQWTTDTNNKNSIKMYRNKGHLAKEMLHSIERGEKCYIASNSKKMIDDLEGLVKRLVGQRYVKVTSDNSQQDDIVEFVKTISVSAKTVDVILASPSMGTGVDITFPDNEIVFENVYGFFEPLVNTHTDIDQQLARVRHPRDVKVYINPRKYYPETDLNVIIENLGRAHVSPHAVTFTDDGQYEIDYNDPLLKIYAEVIAYRTASSANIYENFINHKKLSGYEISFIAKDDKQSDLGNQKLTGAKRERIAHDVERFIQMSQLSDEQFFGLYSKGLNAKRIKSDERVLLEKSIAERALSIPLTKDIIKEILEKGFIQKLDAFYSIQNNKHLSVIANWSLGFIQSSEFQGQYLPKVNKDVFVQVVLIILGLLEEGILNFRKRITQQDLDRFATFCETNRVIIGEITGRPTRMDVKERALMTLNPILAEIGLAVRKMKRQRQKGTVSHVYAISPKILARMERLAKHYTPITKATVLQEADCVTADGKLDYKKFQSTYHFDYASFLKKNASLG